MKNRINYNPSLDLLAMALRMQKAGKPIHARACLMRAAKLSAADEALEILDSNNEMAFGDENETTEAEETSIAALTKKLQSQSKRKLKANEPNLYSDEGSGLPEDTLIVNQAQAADEVEEALPMVEDMIAEELIQIANEMVESEEVTEAEVTEEPSIEEIIESRRKQRQLATKQAQRPRRFR